MLTLCIALVACTASGPQPAAIAAVGTAGAPPLLATSAAGVASYAGCPVFTPNDTYNAVVANLPLDPKSAAYIASMRDAGNTAGFYASTGVEQVNLANAATPKLSVAPRVRWHSFPVPIPWQPGFYIEPLSDRHAMVVDAAGCRLYETYDTRFSAGMLSAYSGANWDMTKPFAPLPPGKPSAMASGLSLFAGMVRWEDYQSGAIRHALNWAAIAHTASQYGFVRPASDTDQLPFRGTSSLQLPYGARLRLHADFSTAGWGPQATMVVNAMKTYGVFLADTGASGNALYFANAPDGSNPWNKADLAALSKIRIDDFDVVRLGPAMKVPGH